MGQKEQGKEEKELSGNKQQVKGPLKSSFPRSSLNNIYSASLIGPGSTTNPIVTSNAYLGPTISNEPGNPRITIALKPTKPELGPRLSSKPKNTQIFFKNNERVSPKHQEPKRQTKGGEKEKNYQKTQEIKTPNKPNEYDLLSFKEMGKNQKDKLALGTGDKKKSHPKISMADLRSLHLTEPDHEHESVITGSFKGEINKRPTQHKGFLNNPF